MTDSDSEYDDGQALRCYYVNNLRQFMTDAEREGLRLSWLRFAAGLGGKHADEFAEQTLAASLNARRVSRQTPDEIYEQLESRLMQLYAEGKLPVNRCPDCHRIARTPQARLCVWCGREWRPSSAC